MIVSVTTLGSKDGDAARAVARVANYLDGRGAQPPGRSAEWWERQDLADKAPSDDGLMRSDLVIIDELGFAPLDLVGGQLLFRFVAAAYERRSLGVASHFPFEAWGHFLPEHTTATSLLDRLAHHAVVVITEGESYRMREAKTRGGGHRTKKSA
jgi:hypothetical protein